MCAVWIETDLGSRLCFLLTSWGFLGKLLDFCDPPFPHHKVLPLVRNTSNTVIKGQCFVGIINHIDVLLDN